MRRACWCSSGWRVGERRSTLRSSMFGSSGESTALTPRSCCSRCWYSSFCSSTGATASCLSHRCGGLLRNRSRISPHGWIFPWFYVFVLSHQVCANPAGTPQFLCGHGSLSGVAGPYDGGVCGAVGCEFSGRLLRQAYRPSLATLPWNHLSLARQYQPVCSSAHGGLLAFARARFSNSRETS